MFGAIQKVAIATGGTALAFAAADKLGFLPGYFVATGSSPALQDEAQQRRNSFIAGAVTGGIVTSIVLLAWRSK